jgi:rare lipoprotein A
MAPEVAGCARAIATIALTGLLLAGCAGSSPVGSANYPAGRGIGTYRVGVPYEIKGVWYYPAIDYNFDRTGIASWYGEEFEGRLTANGEIFDLNELTAAHTTLPMPSIVQVTNLQNGRSLQLRVNDRGPFVDGRLIDVSRRAAQLLGFENQGTARVRVTILKDESIAAAEDAMRSSGQILVAQASGAAAAPASAPARSSVSAAPAMGRVRSLQPSPATAAIEPRPASPPHIAAVPSEPPEPSPAPASQPPQTPPSQIAMMPSEPPPSPPPPLRTTPSTRYRFALISPAEAAELPPARGPVCKPETVATLPRVANMPPLPSRVSGTAREPIGRIFVQAGAFSRRDNAERVQSRIARLGSVQVTSVSTNGVAMYRVRLGPLGSAVEANRLLARIVDSGYPGARIVGD